MKLTPTTDPGQLAELMGSEATLADGHKMMAKLLSLGFDDTDEISESFWARILDEVMTGEVWDEDDESPTHGVFSGYNFRLIRAENDAAAVDRWATMGGWTGIVEYTQAGLDDGEYWTVEIVPEEHWAHYRRTAEMEQLAREREERRRLWNWIASGDAN